MAKFTPNKYNIGKVQLTLLSHALVGGKWIQIREKKGYGKPFAFCWEIVLTNPHMSHVWRLSFGIS